MLLFCAIIIIIAVILIRRESIDKSSKSYTPTQLMSGHEAIETQNSELKERIDAAKHGDGKAQLAVGTILMSKEMLGHEPSDAELESSAYWLRKARDNGTEGADTALRQLNVLLTARINKIDRQLESIDALSRKSKAAAEYIEGDQMRRWLQDR